MITKISLSFITTVLLGTNLAQAQIYQSSNRIPVADNTLGTQVTGANNNFTINGGSTRGSSIFHSFQDFSVPTGGNATFSRTEGTQSIVTRVTGNLSSDINGIVNTQGANFFLINPNGVVFGSNAQLNVGSSLLTTTANSATFADANGIFYTLGTSSINDTPLLSVSPNVELNINRLNFFANSAPITNFANLRPNNTSQYIGLVGGDITLDAGNGNGNITAPGGRVDIGGLRSAGTANITAQGFEYRGADTTGASGFVRSDLTLIDGARIDVTTNQPVGSVNPFFFPNATSAGSVINIDVTNVRIFNRESITSATIRFKEPNARTEEAPAATAAENNPLPRARRIGLRRSDRGLVAQACESGNSKLALTGRGGIPSNANDSLGSDTVWQDPRTTNNLVATITNNIEPLLPPPAIDWAMDNHGKIALIAARSGSAAIGLRVGCSQ
jgi:filamentous hemagglutinin family protein